MKKLVKIVAVMAILSTVFMGCKNPSGDENTPGANGTDSDTPSTETPETPDDEESDETTDTVSSPVILFELTTDYQTDAHCKVLFEVSELNKYKDKTNAKVVFTTTGGIDYWDAGSWGHFFGCTNKDDCYNSQSGDKLELVGGTIIDAPISDVITAFENSTYVSCNLWSTELVKIEVTWE